MHEDVLTQEIKGLRELMNEKFTINDEKHDLILEQTSKTNGRVTRLETFKNIVLGALILMNAVLLPCFFILFQSWLNK